MTAALPPEISSNIIYSGPGAGSFVEAATAWQATAAELDSFAAGYRSTVSNLTGVWLGPSAIAMTANAAGYATWIETLAVQARQVGASAMEAATAFNAVHAAITSPMEVAANRTQLATLIATNVLGQNFPAIAATEAQYMQMWARNIAALLGYQSASSAATAQLTPTTPDPSPAASPATGPAPAAVGLGNLFTPGTNTATGGVAGFLNFVDGSSGASLGTFLNSTFLNGIISSSAYTTIPLAFVLTALQVQANQIQQAQAEAQQRAAAEPPAAPAAVTGAGAGSPGLASASAPERVSARLAAARSVGPLSVPPSWKTADQPYTARPLEEAGMPFGAVGMPMGSSFGGAGGTPAKRMRPPPEYGMKPPPFIPRPPQGG